MGIDILHIQPICRINHSGGKICLRGVSNRYISAKPDGAVSCDKEEVGDWEMFEWLTEYTSSEKEKTVKGSIFSQRRQRSDSMSSSSSSMSSASGSVAAQGKHIFRSRTLGLKPAGEPLKFNKV